MTDRIQADCAVRPLALAERGVAETTLVAAFATDPMILHLFPQESARVGGMRRLFGFGLRHTVELGVVDAVAGGGGVALWLRSEVATASATRLVGSGVGRLAWDLGWGAAWRVWGFLRCIERIRVATMEGRHWYLLNLAVAPGMQGQGSGSALLRAGMERACRGGRPCFLETTKESNVGYYERHGFRVVAEGALPGGGPRVWGMAAGGRC